MIKQIQSRCPKIGNSKHQNTCI